MKAPIDCLDSADQWSNKTALCVSYEPLWHVVAGNEAALEYKGHSDDEDDGDREDDDDFDDDDDDFDDDEGDEIFDDDDNGFDGDED